MNDHLVQSLGLHVSPGYHTVKDGSGDALVFIFPDAMAGRLNHMRHGFDGPAMLLDFVWMDSVLVQAKLTLDVCSALPVFAERG